MSAMKRYLRGMHEKFGHLATWFPDEKLKLGDVGVLEGGRFFQKTTLEALRIPFKARPGGGGGDWDHTSGSDVQVSLSAKAAVAPVDSPAGRAVVSLGSTGAFLFQSINCRTEKIENMAAVGDEIIFAYRRNAYERNWIVVDRLVRAASATILISDSSSAEIEFSADAPLASLADASLEIQAKRMTGEVTRFVASKDLTPLFGASCLNGIFTPRVDPMRGTEAEHGHGESPGLTTLTIEDQLGAR